MDLVKQEELQAELSRVLALENAHKKAEGKIIERANAIEQAFARSQAREEEQAFNDTDRRRLTVKAVQAQLQEEHHNRRSEALAQKAERKEAQKMVKQFLSKRFWIEN